ncbi:MAG: GLPGLI family protein [Bacteroidota bacterium]
MKTMLMVAVGSLITMAAAAQLTEGKVIYERKMNMHKSLPPEAEQMKAMIPEFQTSKMELAFKDQQSLYKPFKSDDDDMPTGDGGGGGGGMRVMRFGGGGGANSESFKDYEKDTKTEIRELGPKKYLLDDSLKHYSWKLSPDTMTIMGHLCHKATTTIKGGVMGMAMQRFGGGGGGNRGGDSASRAPRVMPDQPAVAWYADDIPSPSGPDDFGGLPGLILYIDINEGSLVFTPLSFETKPGTVKAPSGAKKISREEYRALAEQQIGGMRRGGGGGGQQIIIRQ